MSSTGSVNLSYNTVVAAAALPTGHGNPPPAPHRHGLLSGLQNVDLVDPTAPDLRRGPDNAWCLRQLLVQGFSSAVFRNLWQQQQQQQHKQQKQSRHEKTVAAERKTFHARSNVINSSSSNNNSSKSSSSSSSSDNSSSSRSSSISVTISSSK